jgi:hypothetical protein
MNKNWKEIARASNLLIPDEQFERITPTLDVVEAAFRPLVARIPITVEPAIAFSLETDE